MFLLGAAIAFPQVPTWLALGIGATVPPLAYLCYVFNKAGQRAGDYNPIDITTMFAGNSGSIALGLAVRFWREYALIEHRPFAFTCLGIAAALSLLVHFTRGNSTFSHFRFLLFALYFGGVLGVANTHFDSSAPRFVQGYVTDYNKKWSGLGGKRWHYTIAPFLFAPSREIRFAPGSTGTVDVGSAVCGVWRQGAIGFPWYQTRIGLCSPVVQTPNVVVVPASYSDGH